MRRPSPRWRRSTRSRARSPGSGPIDSEHSAIWQCLVGESMEDVAALILTASGGPFLDASPADAGRGHPGAGAPAPDLEHGREDHHRLRDAREQGPGGHRGTLAVRCRLRRHRGRHPPAERRPLRRPLPRRLPQGPAGYPRHATPDPVRPDVPATASRRPPRRPTSRDRPARLPRAGRGAVPGAPHRPRGRAPGSAGVGGAHRRRRGRRRPLPRRDPDFTGIPRAAGGRGREVRRRRRTRRPTSTTSWSSTPRSAPPSRPVRSEPAPDGARAVGHHDRPVHPDPRRPRRDPRARPLRDRAPGRASASSSSGSASRRGPRSCARRARPSTRSTGCRSAGSSSSRARTATPPTTRARSRRSRCRSSSRSSSPAC